jgi:hypothetical protein
MTRVTTATIAGVALLQIGVGAINVRMNQEDIRRATDLTRFPSTDAQRAQFHAPYVADVKSALVEYFRVERIEVITPFRRLELIAEDHARMHDLFARGGLHDAEEALAPWRSILTVIVQMRFDQTRAIPGVPKVDVTIEDPSGVIVPTGFKTEEIHERSGDLTWLDRGTIEATFDVGDIAQAPLPVVVSWKGKEVTRARFNFEQLE